MIQNEDFQDELGNNHVATSAETPIRADAFVISDDEKIELIKKDVEKILNTLGLDLTDDNLAIMKSIIEDDKEFYDGILFTEQDYQELKQKYMQIIRKTVE